MRHTSKLSFVLFLVVTGMHARAQAQPAAQATVDASSVRADDLAQKGNDLALQDKWTEAEPLYQQAWALKRSYDIGGNLGITELALGKHRDAAEHLSFAIGHFPANGKPEHRDLLLEKLTDAREHVGVRTIEVSAACADVLVGGATVGVAPLPSEVFLVPGTTTVEARLAGYEAEQRTVNIVAGSSDRIVLNLRPSGATGGLPVGALALGCLAAGFGLAVTIAAYRKRTSAAALRNRRRRRQRARRSLIRARVAGRRALKPYGWRRTSS
jgi:hypothetical protein